MGRRNAPRMVLLSGRFSFLDNSLKSLPIFYMVRSGLKGGWDNILAGLAYEGVGGPCVLGRVSCA